MDRRGFVTRAIAFFVGLCGVKSTASEDVETYNHLLQITDDGRVLAWVGLDGKLKLAEGETAESVLCKMAELWRPFCEDHVAWVWQDGKLVPAFKQVRGLHMDVHCIPKEMGQLPQITVHQGNA